MGKPAENYWRIIASEQREPRPRDAVLKDIALALVTNHGAPRRRSSSSTTG